MGSRLDLFKILIMKAQHYEVDCVLYSAWVCDAPTMCFETWKVIRVLDLYRIPNRWQRYTPKLPA